jgi:uncharacterized protein YidB (DUF937 family)
MFDVLVQELAKRLSLGDKAKGLLSMLLSLIFDEKRGGFAGFIDRFRSKGMTELVTSWLGNSENRSLTQAQLESALGPQVLQQMASRLDLAPGALNTALTHLLPSVIDKLSPDGRLPSRASVPDAIKPYLAPFADFSSTAVMPETVAAQAVAHTISHGPAQTSGRNKLWLLLIPVLIAPLFFIHQCSKAPVKTEGASAQDQRAIDLPVVVQPTETLAAPSTETPIHQDGIESQSADSASN